MYQEQLERFLLRNWYDLNEQKLTLHQLIDKTGVLLTEKRIEETIEQALEKRLKDFYEKHKS